MLAAVPLSDHKIEDMPFLDERGLLLEGRRQCLGEELAVRSVRVASVGREPALQVDGGHEVFDESPKRRRGASCGDWLAAPRACTRGSSQIFPATPLLHHDVHSGGFPGDCRRPGIVMEPSPNNVII